MKSTDAVIEIRGLHKSYGATDAVNGLDLMVRPGRCYGFFGRNGAGKTTTIKCLLNLLKPNQGTVRVFGRDPSKQEVEVKSRLAYVPDQVAFYPWMTVNETLRYLESFRRKWNRDIENDLLERFDLDASKLTTALSKGQRTQLALISAVCPEPELLVLDEPTSGLDPIVRREFIETVIGAYQEADPERRTILVSTHLIREFEGLIDEFTIINNGREVVSMEADTARRQFQRVRARFVHAPPDLAFASPRSMRREGREVEMVLHEAAPELLERLRGYPLESFDVESLSLEEIFVSSLR